MESLGNSSHSFLKLVVQHFLRRVFEFSLSWCSNVNIASPKRVLSHILKSRKASCGEHDVTLMYVDQVDILT